MCRPHPLRCHGRIIENMIGKDNLIQFDAFSYYEKYTDLFDADSIPESERREVAQKVAVIVLEELNRTGSADLKQEKTGSCS